MTKKVDPRIYLPPLAGYEYASGVDLTGATEAGDFTLDVPPGGGAGLRAPSTVTVIEQIFRKDATGKTVVDLIVEVEDVPGATEYEIRTSTA